MIQDLTPTRAPHTAFTPADDKRNGRGTFTIAETGDKYDGEWKNGKVCMHACMHVNCGGSRPAWRNGVHARQSGIQTPPTPPAVATTLPIHTPLDPHDYRRTGTA